MAAKYRVGIIGHTGRGDYGHGLDAVWNDIPQAEVIAVADADPQGRAAAAKRTNAQRAYADYREMFDRERLDLAAVCPRWIDQHAAMLTTCAEHGCHVYVEKPFCRTLEEADEVVRAFEMRHLKLAIAHTNRYTPQLQIARKLIREGAIGEILEMRARGKEDARRGGGEDLWVLGTHMLDLMRALAGDVDWCFATVTQDGRPIGKDDVQEGNEGIGPLAGDAVDATYRFQNGIFGYFASHRGAAGNPSRFGLTVFGSRGAIEFQSGYRKTAYLLQDPAWSPGRTNRRWRPISSAGVDQPESERGANHHGGNRAAVLDLIDAVKGDRLPKSSLYDARAATEMIAAVFDSQRIGGPVAFPLINRKNPLTMLS